MRRRAFTLIELLVVIVIIGMIASLSLGGLYAARESARKASTRATIIKLDILVRNQFAELHTRRSPFASTIRGQTTGAVLTPKAAANLRLQAIRWIAKTEMPVRKSDVEYPKAVNTPPYDILDIGTPTTLEVTDLIQDGVTTSTETWKVPLKRTAIARRLFRRFVTDPPSDENAPAELLYAWLTLSDREAIEQFQASNIGDTDSDGWREFVDGWGHPIKFLRWPTGFSMGDPLNDHDPFDNRRIDRYAFRVEPLIWSNGPDGLSGLDLVDVRYSWDTIYTNKYGKPVDANHEEYDAHHDNITNQMD